MCLSGLNCSTRVEWCCLVLCCAVLSYTFVHAGALCTGALVCWCAGAAWRHGAVAVCRAVPYGRRTWKNGISAAQVSPRAAPISKPEPPWTSGAARVRLVHGRACVLSLLAPSPLLLSPLLLSPPVPAVPCLSCPLLAGLPLPLLSLCAAWFSSAAPQRWPAPAPAHNALPTAQQVLR